MRPYPVLGLLVLGFGPSLAAQTQGPMPMSLKVTPARSPVGGQVAFQGTTAADGKRMTAQIRVTLPDGTSRILPAPLTPVGDYAIRFSGTTAPGVYRVSAIAPDGAVGDTASFKVLTSPQMMQEVSLEWEELQTAEDSAVALVHRLVDTLPASPAKDDVEKKLVELEKRLGQGKADVARFRQAAGALDQIVTKYPEAAPALEPVMTRLAAWREQSDAERVALNQKLIQSAKESVTCEQINAAAEGINVASAIVNLAGTAVAIVGDFYKDWLVTGVQSVLPPALRNDAGFSLFTAQVIKNGKAATDALASYTRGHAPGAIASAIPDLLFDLAGLLTAKLFDSYCEKYTGPFDADLHVEFANAAGKVWWTYDITIQGRLTLRYGKGATNAAKVKGEFVGSASHYGMWEDALRTFNPNLMSRVVMFKRIILPVALPFVDTEGSYVGALGPGAFFVPVDGTLIDRKLAIRVNKATTDFEGVTAKAIWVVGGVGTMGFPIVLTNSFPYRGAYTVLRGGLTGLFSSADLNANPDPTPFAVKNAGRILVVDETVRQDKIKGNGFEVSTRIHLKACNPSCP